MKRFLDPRTLPSPILPGRTAEVGGKAVALEALRDAGFPVPAFDVLPVGWLKQFTTFHALHETLDTGLRGTDSQDSGAMHHRFASLELPPEQRVGLREVIAGLGAGPLCVRSSGTSEDLPDLSFAGQYESILDLQGSEAIEAAVKQCWSSLFQPGVRQYFRQNGLPFDKAGMALIVQRFIRPDFAGVGFTVHPLTGREDHLLLEYCPGCADKLVSGRVTPQTAVVDHRLGKLIEGTLPPGLTPERCRIFREIQALFGRPQDIEWAIEGDRLWIVQSRPITRIRVDASFGTWTTADFRDGGVSSSVVTPFMWSLYQYIWQYAMPGYFRLLTLLDPGADKRSWGNAFFGRPYWNLGEVVHCLLKIPGFKESNLFSDLGIRTESGYCLRSVPYSFERITAVLPTLLRLERNYRTRIVNNRRFRREFAAFTARFVQGAPPSDLGAIESGEFARLFRQLITEVYFKTETSYFFTIYNTSNAKLDFKVRLDAVNDAGHDLSYIKLISGLLRVKHLATLKALHGLSTHILAIPGLAECVLSTPAEEIDEVLAGRPEAAPILRHMDSLLERYGYHSARELDISAPRWDEDRSTVWRMLKTYLRDPDPENLMTHEKRQNALYRAEVDRARAAFDTAFHRLVPVERMLFFRALLRTRTYCWWREEMRDYSSRVYAIVRRWALEAGRRLGLAEGEVFWLTWQETLAGLEGRSNAAEIRSRIEAATEYARMYRLFENPDELGAGFLAKGEVAAGPATSTGDPTGTIASPSSKTGSPNRPTLSGVGCSPGIAEGIVRVVPDLERIDRIRRGEILVTKFTDPGWTPIFHILGGVITETGGILSHAAVISREYGIPAVLNLPSATHRLRDGQRIRLDGSTGQVILLD